MSFHGLANEEYLIFCETALLDELSSHLKPVPRRMFEYYRTKLWQPDDRDVTRSTDSKVSTAAIVGPYDVNGRVIHRSNTE